MEGWGSQDDLLEAELKKIHDLKIKSRDDNIEDSSN
jgi:hypothetical protein